MNKRGTLVMKWCPICNSTECNCKNKISIDDEICYTIIMLNKYVCGTTACCSGHKAGDTFYISFSRYDKRNKKEEYSKFIDFAILNGCKYVKSNYAIYFQYSKNEDKYAFINRVNCYLSEFEPDD